MEVEQRHIKVEQEIMMHIDGDTPFEYFYRNIKMEHTELEPGIPLAPMDILSFELKYDHLEKPEFFIHIAIRKSWLAGPCIGSKSAIFSKPYFSYKPWCSLLRYTSLNPISLA